MNAGAKLATYGLALVAVLGAGAAVGEAVGPIDVGESEDHSDGTAMDGTSMDGMNMGAEGGTASGELPAGGLLVSQDGYTFDVADRALSTGQPDELSFVIEGPDGNPVEDYDLLHDRELHLIVVSSDLSGFHHVHPVRDGEGTWSIDLPALPAGAYRAFADFRPAGGEQLTLGIDLTAPGTTAAPAPLRERRSTEVDGYEVTLEGTLDPDASSEVTLTVRRDGRLVTTEPYLGAAGHLVAIRDGDLAYLHVHPLDEEPNGPVRFAVEVPSAGDYGFYFDFAHNGEVHSASFFARVDEADPDPDQNDESETEADHDTTGNGDDADHGTDN